MVTTQSINTSGGGKSRDASRDSSRPSDAGNRVAADTGNPVSSDTQTLNTTVQPIANPGERRTERVDMPEVTTSTVTPPRPNAGEVTNGEIRQTAAESESVPTDAQVERIAMSDSQATRAALARQEQFSIILPPPATGEHTHEDVTINGFTTQIQRGVPLKVSRGVYQVLVAAGKIPPQREEDFSLSPREVKLNPQFNK